MNVDVVTYNERNGAQIIDAKELLDQILLDGVDDVKIIVDVGCGSGNVTKILAQTIPHEKLYAFDIDPKMVAHAIKENETEAGNTGSIEFFIQDISVPWDELPRKLLDLEGIVDIVWSNRVLHWVLDDLRYQAATNIVRLLRRGGRSYINTTLTADLNLSLPPQEKSENEKLMKVPSRETQHKLWRDYFSKAGLSNLKVEYLEKEWDNGTNEKFRGHLDYFFFWKRYIPQDIPVERHDEIIEKLGDQLLRSVGHPIGSPAVKPIEELHVWYYGQFRITGTK